MGCEHFFLLKPILKDLYVLVVWNSLWLVRVVCTSYHYLAVKDVGELFTSLGSTVCTIGRVRFLSEDNLSVLVVSLKDAVHHVLAFVLHSEITDQLLWSDELGIFYHVALTIRKPLLCPGIGDQVLTWRLDGESSRLDKVARATHTNGSGISLLLVL